VIITHETTVKNLLEQYPECLSVFEKHGVNATLVCGESILDSELSTCESMCHIDDLGALIKDLQIHAESND
jgi:hypothetical protein